MEIEQLASKWQQTHDRVEEIHQFVEDLNRKEVANRNRWTHFRLKIGPSLELVIGGLIALSAGNYLANNWTKVFKFPLGSIPTLLTLLFGVFLIWQAIIQIILVDKLDYANAIALTQSALLDLRKFRARCGQCLLLTGVVFWNIPPVAMLQWIGSYDVVEKLVGANGFPVAWMFINALVGVAIAALLVVIARRLPETSAFNRFISDVFAGGEVERAERQLAEISSFRASV